MNISTLNKSKLSKIATRYGTVFFFVLICAAFTILRLQSFFRLSNLITVLRQISILAILGGGLTMVMITGRIDLTIGYTTSAISVLVGALMVDYGMNLWGACAIGLLAGALLGAASGTAVAYLGIPDFIATLSMGFLISGFNQAYTKGHPISNLPGGFAVFGKGSLFGVPVSIYLMFIFLIMISVILGLTRFGRHVYAIGGNQEAAMMSGLNVKLDLLLTYVISGVGCALGAIILSSRLQTCHPTAGDSYLMDALATVYVGATAFKNGEPNILGTFVGALIIGVLNNGLTLCNVAYYNQDIAKGAVIFLAVTITSIQRAKKK